MATTRSKSGAAYFVVQNSAESADLLISAVTEEAKRVEFHSSRLGPEGIMRMEKIVGNILVPAGGSRNFQQGGDHMMLMGLTRSFSNGDKINVTLIFEHAGEIEVEFPVRVGRGPASR